MRLIHLGLNIAFYRKLQGKTQEQLAEHVGISAKYLSQIETASVAQPISLRLLVCAGQTPLACRRPNCWKTNAEARKALRSDAAF